MFYKVGPTNTIKLRTYIKFPTLTKDRMQSKRGNINVKLVFAKNILVYLSNILDKKLHLIWVNIRANMSKT